MGNSFCRDWLLQAPDPDAAARFYRDQLGFEITDTSDEMISLCGDQTNLFIERGEPLGPIGEVIVDDVDRAKARLIAQGCVVIKDEPHFPRCYIKDPFGLVYNLRGRRI